MIIGICGFSGSGKDTIGNYLITKGFTKLSFSSVLKDVLSVLFGWDRELIEGLTEKSRLWREQKDFWWSEKLKFDVTPRKMLQMIGTDLFRNLFNKDIWIFALERKMKQYQNVVITDCRFVSEIEMLENIGAKMVYVMRDEPDWFSKKEIPVHLHISEYDWINKIPSIRIDNDGTIEDLHFKIKSIL